TQPADPQTDTVELGLYRLEAHRQLVGFVFIVAGTLAGLIQTGTDVVPFLQKFFALLGVLLHHLDGFTQNHPRFGKMLCLLLHLLARLADFRFSPLTAHVDLFQTYLLCTELRAQPTITTPLRLGFPTECFALLLNLLEGLAALLQLQAEGLNLLLGLGYGCT